MTFSKGQRWILISTLSFCLMNMALKSPARLSVHQIVFFRAIFALVFLLIHIRWRGLSLRSKNMPLLITRGLLGTLGLYFFVASIKAMPLGTAVTIQYLSPLFALVISTVVLQEGASTRIWIVALASFAGVLLIERSDFAVTPGALSIGIISALCSGLVQNLIRKMRGDADPIVIAFYFPALTVPLSLIPTAENWIWPTAYEWFCLGMAGFLSYIAQVYYTKAFQAEPVARIVTLSYIGPPLAIVVGWTFFGESMPHSALAGITIVLLSAWYSTKLRC